ncbi:hypothetical protein ARMGADRAFT_281627 [Armillaria gallica]|uniref:Uncharacterized protein n=1 Tax=Armillaria gallica TaxID=47427 RepID=A0A2H3E9K7_ARMGA|nr:hypothetical protein ARMGADRAFT_281627 [Armillaria gallica]
MVLSPSPLVRAGASICTLIEDVASYGGIRWLDYHASHVDTRYAHPQSPPISLINSSFLLASDCLDTPWLAHLSTTAKRERPFDICVWYAVQKFQHPSFNSPILVCSAAERRIY